MIINIVAGGPEDHLPDLTEYLVNDVIWVGVDRGVYHLLQRNISPSIAFGDFDSVTSDELIFIEDRVTELKKYRPEKDETDMELALNWALKQHPSAIRIFGATGGRLDHLFANVHLLLTPIQEKNEVDICIIDRNNIVFIKEAGSYKIEKMDSKKYISFVPVTLNIQNLTLEGFKFPLKNRHISIGSTLCISNELISDYGTFSFSEGILIVIRSHD
ncbi:thiamine diphosphokinase [Neobacillus sp. MER 74]|uniref:thiamine diphosphokinase n=1 Tax=unclassified Neobacillus TaxID=2675272 RepID=UPI00203CB16A|nr:thiamine diphosphokinase [Neobacillus sp. MER 74]MCM3113979.1 thiamine diphosphokinase [Neobacillus sp. MER 74]